MNMTSVKEQKLSAKKRRKWYYTLAVSLAAIVVFSTTYALILPAITMEKRTARDVIGWNWVDRHESLIQSGGQWYLSLPGASVNMPATGQDVRQLLPEELTATMSDGTTGTLPLEWDLSVLPDSGGYEGSYSLFAGLPQGYTLHEGIPQPQVMLVLGGAGLYADYPGNRRTLTQAELDAALKTHIVQGPNPPNVTVNLFDYTSAKDGATQKDLLDRNPAYNAAGSNEWNRGINQNRLLLFGDSMVGAGYWNIGAGAGKKWAQKYTNLKGIVENTLKSGYPMINLSEARTPLNDVTIPGELTNLYRAENPYAANNLANALIAPALSSTVLQGAGAIKKSDNTWDYSKVDASLDYLFDLTKESGSNYKKAYQNVTGLFQMDDKGYYYYNARNNFAEFVKDESGDAVTQDGQPSDGSFILYDGPAVWRTDGGWDGKGFNGDMSLGNFYPFNTGRQVFDSLETTADGKEILSSSVGHLDNTKWSQPLINQSTRQEVFLNHHMGMSLEIDFTQPVNGKMNMGATGKQDMIFEFSGDDDVWVFVDDVLVLDIGGIHSELYGTINFATGEVVTGQSWRTNGKIPQTPGAEAVKTTLYDLFTKALGKEKTDAMGWNEMADGKKTFASSSAHTLKMFYLERGNYDSSLYLRFNLQPMLYHHIRKVDQNGAPLAGVEFDLYAARLKDGLTQTSSKISDYEETSGVLATLKTAENGSATFLEEDESGEMRPFNFADRYSSDDTMYYILKETKTPAGYRPLPENIVLQFNPATAMLVVANRYQTGSYASFVSNIVETGSLTYGAFHEGSGDIQPSKIEVTDLSKKDGLVIAVPMLLQKGMTKEGDSGKWEALYGSNTAGFNAIMPAERTAVAWRTAILKALLYQCSDEDSPKWYLKWNDENLRLEGILNDLPGRADRYALYNSQDADMKMVYGVIEPYALQKLGVTGTSDEERYKNLSDYIRRQVEEALAGFDENGGQTREQVIDAVISRIGETIQKTTSDGGSYMGNGTPAQRGFSFLNTDQFQRDFRSLIYIPNEQRELRVWKVDEDGKSINGAEFTLYQDAEGTGGDIAASGVTARVDGQDGTLIFMPEPPTDAAGNVLPGYAKMGWAASDCSRFLLKETKAPPGYQINDTAIPVVLGVHSIYADAGTADDGVTVMAGVGKLMQTMTKYAADDMVNITLRDITAIAQTQESLSSGNEWNSDGWVDDKVDGADMPHSMNLHYGINQVVNYGLHDQDGGKTMNPFFVTDTGFLRTRVMQNSDALKDSIYHDNVNMANWDDLGDMNITSLFSQTNIVVVTNKKPEDTNTGKLTIRKTITGPDLNEEDYQKNFTFTVTLLDPDGQPLTDKYYYFGTDRSGYIENGGSLSLRHDEAVTVLGLPPGTQWSVKEIEPDGWHVISISDTIHGSIEADQTAAAVFINIKGIDRTLEGLTWLDESMDGIQNEAPSSRLSGVKVQLLKLKENGNPAKEDDYEPYHFRGDPNQPAVEIETGQQISVRAAGANAAAEYAQGRYKFTDLPAGTFAVRFVDGPAVKIAGFLASPQNQGDNEEKDSDGIPIYSGNPKTLEKTVILGIEMPPAEEMDAPLYESKYHDSGFYPKGYELPDTGGPGTIVYSTAGLLLTVASYVGYTVKRRRER